MGKMEQLLREKRSIFTIHDLRVIWGEPNANALKSSVQYFVGTGKLRRLKRGVYSLDLEYDHLELASKLVFPSYLSLETALQYHGVIYQTGPAITSVSLYHKKFRIDSQDYLFHKMNEGLLLNPLGVENREGKWMASIERAVADYIYLKGERYFDRLDKINKQKLRALAAVYDKKVVSYRIRHLVGGL